MFGKVTVYVTADLILTLVNVDDEGVGALRTGRCGGCKQCTDGEKGYSFHVD
jgi:hypothetical protein